MATIQHRRASKAQWAAENPVLAPGELGLEVGPGNGHDRFKIGNGLSTWNQLKFFINEEEINIDVGRLSEEALDERYIRLPAGGNVKQILVKSFSGGLEWANMESSDGAAGDGGLATALPSYKPFALGSDNDPLKILTIGDFTNDGLGNPGGPDQWRKTWPLKMAVLLRTLLGLSEGGRNWIPAVTPMNPSNYVYRPSILGPVDRPGYDFLNIQSGVPGGLWMQEGHTINKFTVTYNLNPGVTSIDIVNSRYDDGIIDVMPATGSPIEMSGNARLEFTRINNPGASVTILPRDGVGYALFGIVEYIGDENAGVHQYNLSQGSAAAFDYAAWLSNESYSFKELVSNIQPRLVLMSLGAQDFSRGRTIFQFTSALTEIRDHLMQAAPGAILVPIIRPLDDESITEAEPEATWGQFSSALLSWAEPLDITVLDLRETIPSEGEFYLQDKLHLNELGNTAYATAVADFLKVDVSGKEIEMLDRRYANRDETTAALAERPTEDEGSLLYAGIDLVDEVAKKVTRPAGGIDGQMIVRNGNDVAWLNIPAGSGYDGGRLDGSTPVGIRPWKRGSQATRKANTEVLPGGDLVVTDDGGIYAGDGSTETRKLRGLHPSRVDLRDHIVSITARSGRDPLYIFNSAEAIAAVELKQGVLYIPPGDWQPNAVNVALNSATGDALSGPRQRFTYIFEGAGRQSRFLLPPGMIATDCAFIANAANVNDFHTHPKIIVRDLAISGSDRVTIDPVISGGFLLSHQRSFSVQRVDIAGCKDPFRVDGYTDLISMKDVNAHDMAAGSYILNASASTGGDAWEFDHLIPFGTGGLYLNLTRGATLTRCISGWYRFTNCDISLIDNRNEGDGAVNSIPSYTIRGSRVHVRSGVYQSRPNKPVFAIDDSLSTYASVLTVDSNVQSISRLDSPGSVEGPQMDPFIDIVSATIQTTLHLHNVRTALWGQWSGGSDTPRALVAPYVTASGSATIATLLSNVFNRILLGMDCTLRWSNGQWDLHPYEQRQAVIGVPKMLASDQISTAVTAVTSTAYDSTAGLAPGTYRYRMEVGNVAGFSCQKSPERLVTIAAGQIPQLVLDTYVCPVALTIYRGTAADVYTHWARIWVTRESLMLFDQGTYIGGVAWTAGSIPPLHDFNETIECELSRRPFGGTRKTVYNPTIPALGSYSVGDRCINTNPASNQPQGWTCTTAGYPGTWKNLGNLPF